MSAPRPGYALPLLLLDGFRLIIDDLHRELAARGHPDARPLHGFALQAIGAEGTSITELARRLGVSKQAAAKTATALERLGYLHRDDDPTDRRAQRLHITPHGFEMLRVSAEVLDGVRSEWRRKLGAARLDALEDDLEAVRGDLAPRLRLDLPGWLAGATPQP